MIRVTNSMLINDLRRNLNTNMRNMETYNRQLATGRKINLPSDNPGGLIKSLRLRTNLVEGEQYLANIDEAISFMETTDSAADNIGQILNRIRELMVKAAHGTNDEGAEGAIADEIRQLNGQLAMIANTTHGTKHIFAGTNVTEEPFQGDIDDIDNIQWTGNNESVDIEIAVGITMGINTTDEAMNNFFAGDGAANRGIFKLIDDIAEKVENSDFEGVSEELANIDAKIDDLLSTRSKIGAKVNRLELQQSRLESTQVSYTGLLSKNEDADMAEVIINLKMQENVYRASLAAGARIIQPSLVDFLR